MVALIEKSDCLKSPPSFRRGFEFADGLFGTFGLNYESFRNDKFRSHKMGTYVALVVAPAFVVFAVTAFFSNLDKPNILIYALIGAFSGVNCAAKVITVFSNASKFAYFQRKIIEETSGNDRETFECDIQERYVHILTIVTKLISTSYAVAAITLSCMLIIYFLVVSKRWLLPLPMKIIGVDDASHPGYEIHYTYCVTAIMYGRNIIAACDLTFFYSSLFAMYRLDVCKCHCEEIGRSLHDSHRTILKGLKAHSDIFEFIGEVSTACTPFILVEGILSLMLLTVTIFYTKLNPVNLTYTYMLTLLVELSVYCICGQLILNKGEIVAAAIYGSEWYKITNARQRRYIQLFILGAQKPNGLSAWNIFQLSFSSLTSILKSAASYIVFLQNVMD